MLLRKSPEKRGPGRPRLEDEEKTKYQRIAVYPETYKLAKEKSKKNGVSMVDWIKNVVERHG